MAIKKRETRGPKKPMKNCGLVMFAQHSSFRIPFLYLRKRYGWLYTKSSPQDILGVLCKRTITPIFRGQVVENGSSIHVTKSTYQQESLECNYMCRISCPQDGLLCISSKDNSL